MVYILSRVWRRYVSKEVMALSVFAGDFKCFFVYVFDDGKDGLFKARANQKDDFVEAWSFDAVTNCLDVQVGVVVYQLFKGSVVAAPVLFLVLFVDRRFFVSGKIAG